MEKLDFSVSDPPRNGILEILKWIRPSWNNDHLIIKKLEGGLLNRLFYCGLADDTEESDIVAVRLYGTGTEVVIDRNKEVESMKIAHSVGLGAPLYCRFHNGLAYKYYRGNTVSSILVADDVLARGMAKMLATLHVIDYEKHQLDSGRSSDIPNNPFIINLINITKSIMPSFEDSYDDPVKEKIRLLEFPNKDVMMTEMEEYGMELQKMGFSTCFCHGDPNPNNTIYDEEGGDIRLIDWEMSGVDYPTHDIGWYFGARTMVDDGAEESLKFYPNKEYQLKWIRWYLESKAELCGQDPKSVTEAEIKKLYKGSILSVLMRLICAVAYLRMQESKSIGDSETFRDKIGLRMERLDITVSDPPKNGILEILKRIRPSWNNDNLIIKKLEGGLLNRMFYCGLTDDTEESDIVVVKLYGAGTEGLIDRNKEVGSMKIAHSVGLGSPLYCRFHNGLAYKYCRGNTVSSKSIGDDALSRGMAKILATLHVIDHEKRLVGSGSSSEIPNNPFIIHLINLSKSAMPSFKDSYDDPAKEKIRLLEFPNKDDVMAEMEEYGKEIQSMGFSTCFCHGDTNPNNIIYDEERGNIQLIDWEMSGDDYPINDIGWYFGSQIVIDDGAEDSLKLYPNKEYQLKWIRWYLESKAELCGQDPKGVTEADINKLYNGSILCALVRLMCSVGYLRSQDLMSLGDGENFRRARAAQKMFDIIKAEHRAN